MKFQHDGRLDRTVRHLTSEWGWPGAVFLFFGLLALAIGPSLEWLDYRGFPDDYERVTALGFAAFGLVWIFASAAYYRITARRKRSSRNPWAM